MKLVEKLIQTGLLENEAKLYFQLLQLGTQPASILAKKLEIPRTTASLHLENLSKKGIISKSKKGNMFLYSIASSDSLLMFLNSKKQKEISQVNQQIITAQNLLPEIQSFQGKSPSRPKITFYEGIDGITKVYEDTLTSSETLRSLAHADSMHKGIPGYFPEYYKRRSKKGIHIRSIHPNSEEMIQLIKRNTEELREGLLIPKEKFSFTPEIQFYDEKVNIVSWKEKLGIIIESKEIYEAFVVMFELAYEQAKKYN